MEYRSPGNTSPMTEKELNIHGTTVTQPCCKRQFKAAPCGHCAVAGHFDTDSPRLELCQQGTCLNLPHHSTKTGAEMSVTRGVTTYLRFLTKLS